MNKKTTFFNMYKFRIIPMLFMCILLGGCIADVALWTYVVYPVTSEGEKSFKHSKKEGYDFSKIKKVAILIPFKERRRIDLGESQSNVEIIERAFSSSKNSEFFFVRSLHDTMCQKEIKEELKTKGLQYVLDKLKVPKKADAIILGCLDEWNPVVVGIRGYVFSLNISLEMFDSSGELVWSASNTQRDELDEVGGKVALRLADDYKSLYNDKDI